MHIKARYVAVIAGALAAMAVPGAAHATGDSHEGPGHIRNVGLDGCLTAVDDDTTGGSLVRLKPCADDFRQIWLTTMLSADSAGGATVTVRKNARECLQLIGDDLPWNGRLALRDCDEDNPYQVFRTWPADWATPTWRVSGTESDAWLKAFHEHEAPYVSQTKEWPGTYAEWEYLPVGG